MRVLVTGGSGFIGTNLVKRFLEDGEHEILNLDKAPPMDARHRSLWTEIDLLDADGVRRCFGGFRPDWVVHLAGRADCDEDTTVEEGYTANTVGHQNVLDAISAARSVKRAVITSSQYVCGPENPPRDDLDFAPVTVYGESKVITEKLTRQADLDCVWTLVRPTNIWGPWHTRYPMEFWKIAERNLYFHPGGEPVIRCYGYVGNVVEHIVRILMAPAETIDGKVLYLSDPSDDIYVWANAFTEALCGRSARRIPRSLLKLIGKVGDLVSSLSGKPFYITSSRVSSMTSNYVVPGRIEETIAILGPPKYSLHEGVEETVDWLKSHNKQHHQ